MVLAQIVSSLLGSRSISVPRQFQRSFWVIMVVSGMKRFKYCKPILDQGFAMQLRNSF